MPEEPENVISVGGEPALEDADVLGFQPAKDPDKPVTEKRAADVPPVEGSEAPKSAGGPDDGTTEVDQPAEITADDGSVAAAPPQGQKFSFFGRDFDSREAAEQFFRTWEGQISASQRRMTELAENLQRQNRLIEELQSKGTPKTPEPAKTPAKPSRLADSIDWDVYRDLAESKGQDWAAEWLTLKLDEVQEAREEALMARLEEKYASRFEGFDAINAAQEKLQAATSVFEELYDRVDEHGQRIFTELEDQSFLKEMADAWDEIPDNRKLGLRGAYLAYCATKDRRSRSAKPAAPVKKPPVPSPPVQDTTLGGGITSKLGTTAKPRNSVSQALKDELGRVDPVLGF